MVRRPATKQLSAPLFVAVVLGLSSESGAVDGGPDTIPAVPEPLVCFAYSSAYRPEAVPKFGVSECLPLPKWFWSRTKWPVVDPRKDTSGFLRFCNMNRSNCEPHLLRMLFARLGDRFEVRGTYLDRKAVDLDATVATHCQSGRIEEAERQRRDQLDLRRDAENAFRRALASYEKVLAASYDLEIEETDYSIASTLREMGRPEDAVKAFQGLIRDFPGSERVPLYHLAIGNIRFSMGDWKGADRSFALALSFPPSNATICALYGQAWTDFQRGFNQLARKGFDACQQFPSQLHARDFFKGSVAVHCETDAKALGLK